MTTRPSEVHRRQVVVAKIQVHLGFGGTGRRLFVVTPGGRVGVIERIDIDYQVLHDAFFKYQKKPKLTIHGDIYFEGKEEEYRSREFKPGKLSSELRSALGISDYQAPPWFTNMQRFGPPPSYPYLKLRPFTLQDGMLVSYQTGPSDPTENKNSQQYGVYATFRQPEI